MMTNQSWLEYFVSISSLDIDLTLSEPASVNCLLFSLSGSVHIALIDFVFIWFKGK